MKINVNATWDGADVIHYFVQALASNKIEADEKEVKIFVVGKDGKDVEITPDRLKVSFSK